VIVATALYIDPTTGSFMVNVQYTYGETIYQKQTLPNQLRSKQISKHTKWIQVSE